MHAPPAFTNRTPRPPSRLGRHVETAVVAVLVALVLIGSDARPASAHAQLSSTDPVSGSVLEQPPSEVVLTFTEAVTVEADGVRVLDGDGERRDAASATSAGTVVKVPIEGALERGGYVVAWRVVSADGHPINGAFQFSVGVRTQVGADVVDGAFGSASDSRDRQIGNVLRSIAYLCTMIAAGATLVGARLRGAHEPSPVSRRVALIAGVGVVAVVLQVPLQTSLMTGRGWGSVTEAGVLGRALGDGLGWSVGVTVLGLVLIAITAGLPFTGPVPRIAGAGAAMAPAGFVVFGHTRTMSPAAVAYLADLAHVLAAAMWFGGLVALAVVLRRRREADDVVAAGGAVASFSAMAAASLAVVAVSGLIMGWIEVGGIEALTGTTYGKLLLLKVALVGVVVAGGTWNRYRLVPHLSGEAGGAADPAADRRRWELFGRILRLEVAVLVAVVGVTGVLVNETPGKQAIATVSRAEAPFGDGRMEVWLQPGRAGLNDIHVILLGSDGAPEDRYDEVLFSLSLPARDVGPIEAEPVRIGPGHFQLVATDLSIRGDWVITVAVRPDRFTLTEATASFTIS